MQYRRFNDIYAVRVDLGEEILTSLRKLCEAEHIALAQVQAIGASCHAEIGVYDLETREYRREELDSFMEILSLSGNITAMDGKPYIHLHATLADQNHVLHGGHVLSIRVGATCEMFVRVLDATVGRERNDELGINLWDF
ncbi:MAG: DUF296 domain-containing protein [Clostridia bacterium]|nr:DUF296 domain-containing protein [Clostridia bacterium]